jgi:formamidase
VQGHISRVVDIPNACATLWLPRYIFGFDIMPSAAGPAKHIKGGIRAAAARSHRTLRPHLE